MRKICLESFCTDEIRYFLLGKCLQKASCGVLCGILIYNMMEWFKLTFTKCLAPCYIFQWTLSVVEFSFVNPGHQRGKWMGKRSTLSGRLKLNQHERMGWWLSKSLSKRYYLILGTTVMVFVQGLQCIHHWIHGWVGLTLRSQDRELKKIKL